MKLNTFITKIHSAFNDRVQEFNVDVIDNNRLDTSLNHAKKYILSELTRLSSEYKEFKYVIKVKLDENVEYTSTHTILSDSIYVARFSTIDLDKAIVSVLNEYESALEFNRSN